MKEKRGILGFAIFAACLMFFTIVIGCFYVKNFTVFSWQTKRYYFEGDKVIQVKLKTRGGYRLSSEAPVTISRGDKVLCQVIFQTGEQHQRYNVLFEDVMKEPVTGRMNGNEYYCRSDESEHNWEYGVYSRNIDCWVLIRSDVSREAAEECFSRMTFSGMQRTLTKSLDGQAHDLNVFYDDLRDAADRVRKLLGRI